MASLSRSLVIPVYRNETSIPSLVEALRGLAIDNPQSEFETVFVVDGSPDNSYALLRELLPSAGFRSQLLLLSRNFGSFTAIRAGLSVANGDLTAVMAADLQEPPELIEKMFKQLDTGAYDVVVGTRVNRADPFLTRLFSDVFWRIYRNFIEPKVPAGGVDVFACNRDFKKVLLQLDESHSSLIGQIFWMGFRRGEVTYNRQLRQHGTSAWSFNRKMRYLSDSIFSFTDLPIRFLLISGSLGIVFALCLGAAALIGKLSGLITVPGYTATMLVIVFFGALIQLGLGIVGSYTWRAYENTKARPQFLVMRQDSFGT